MAMAHAALFEGKVHAPLPVPDQLRDSHAQRAIALCLALCARRLWSAYWQGEHRTVAGRGARDGVLRAPF
jgi:hypothetical protein